MEVKREWVEVVDRKLRKQYGPWISFTQKFYPSIFDHFRYEGHAVIGEPYGVSMDNLEQFIQFCKENNLTFRIESQAKHHPDCIRIIVEPKEEGDR